MVLGSQPPEAGASNESGVPNPNQQLMAMCLWNTVWVCKF